MIQVIHRAIDILEYVSKDPETPKPLSDIASALDLNAGTCANIIKTLVNRKYLDKADKQKGYSLGSMAYTLTGHDGYKKNLIKAAKDELEALAKKLNENALLAVLNGNLRIAILRANGTNDIQATTPAEKSAYETTSGRLLISMLPDDELQKYIKKYGLPKENVWKEAANPKAFDKQIKNIRSEQHTIQITHGQIVGLAVPVMQGQKVIASIGVYIPQFRFKGILKENTIRIMKEFASRISKKLD